MAPNPTNPNASTTAQNAANTAATNDRNAHDIEVMIRSLMQQNGITNNVGDDITKLAQNYSYDILTPEILQSIIETKPDYGKLTNAFNAKYKAGIDAYEKNFGHRLTYAEYNSYENAANKIFSSYGAKDILTPDVMTSIVGNGIDANELDARFKIANDAVSNMDDYLKDQFKQAYPNAKTDTDIMKAMLLGKDKGHAWLQAKVDTADIQAAYNRYDISSDQQIAAKQFLAAGYSGQQAAQQIAQASGQIKSANTLADIYNVNKSDLGKEILTEAAGGPASQRRAKLTSLEKAEFAGVSGVGSTSLTQNRAGMI